MSISRRNFLVDASMLGLISALLPELAAAQTQSSEAAAEDLPHDSYDFWNGFFDSVNPYSSNYENKAASRGPGDQLPDPAAQTQYLHYDSNRKRLRYASEIEKEELLDHDGNVSVNIALAQFRPANGELSQHPSQFHVDTTQIHPIMGIVAPLTWSASPRSIPTKRGRCLWTSSASSRRRLRRVPARFCSPAAREKWLSTSPRPRPRRCSSRP
jgi:hypothetical protein